MCTIEAVQPTELDKDQMAALRWCNVAVRTDDQAMTRWGHYYQHLRDEGYIRVSDPIGYMDGRYRCIKREVHLTDLGRMTKGLF